MSNAQPTEQTTPPVVTADDLRPDSADALVKSDYSPAFVLGYLSATVRAAVYAHPDDANLRDGLAMYEAYRAHKAGAR